MYAKTLKLSGNSILSSTYRLSTKGTCTYLIKMEEEDKEINKERGK